MLGVTILVELYESGLWWDLKEDVIEVSASPVLLANQAWSCFESCRHALVEPIISIQTLVLIGISVHPFVDY